MSARDDGGPAFPRSDSGYSETFDGMSLRDWFAGQVLTGMATTLSREDIADLGEGVKAGSVNARAAYALADAMLKARGA